MEQNDQPVLILGAGINGAALARELLLNCVPVTLVDTADVCFGATAYSSRLIHGGLRYLEYGEFGLVRESLQERARLLRLAPQFVRPLQLFVPVSTRFSGLPQAVERFTGWALRKQRKPAPRGLWLVESGLWLYAAYARDRTLPLPRVHNPREAGVPSVDVNKYSWLCSYYDAQMLFPERFVQALLTDARELAAENGVAFRLFTYHHARLVGDTVEIRPHAPGTAGDDPPTSREPAASFRPAGIFNATGAWVDVSLQRLAIPSRQLMGGAKGSHLLTFHAGLRAHLRGKGLYAEARDGRPIFILPFGEAVLVGTTDVPFTGSPETAVATPEEINYLLRAVNEIVPDVDLAREDVELHYCGVRPLPYTGQSTPASVTRRHWLEEHRQSPVPFYSVIGGKLTTCRSLAEEAAGTLLERLGRPPIATSRERVVPGGESYPPDAAALAAEQERLAQTLGFSLDQVQAVWLLCGTRTQAILQPSDPARAQADDHESLRGTSLPLRFVRWVIRREVPRRVADLVERRLMLLYRRDLTGATLQHLAELLVEAGVLAPDQMAGEVQACAARLHAHFGKRISIPDVLPESSSPSHHSR
jgi:glycerol-3-phosphate dehydrogenase